MKELVSYSQGMKRLSQLGLVMIVTCVAMLVMASATHAASSGTAQAWVPSSTPVTDPNNSAFSDPRISEAMPVCTYPNGNPVPSEVEEKFGNAIQDAFKAYSDAVDDGKNAAEAMTKFREKINKAISDDGRLKNLLNGKAKTPDDVIVAGAENCRIKNGYDLSGAGPDWDLPRIVFNPGEFIADMATWLPKVAAGTAYNQVGPLAFQYAFFTPHVERGETFMTIRNCAGGSSSSGISKCKGVEELGFDQTLLSGQDAVERQGTVPWLRFMRTMTYLTSMTFTIVALFIALMLQRPDWSSARKAQALRVIPLMLVASLVMIGGPWILGGMISFTNYFAQAIFSGLDCGSAGASCTAGSDFNLALSNLSFSFNLLGAEGAAVRAAGVAVPHLTAATLGSEIGVNLFGDLLTIIVLAMATWFMVFILAAALLRQVLLIIAIIAIGPMAALLIFDSTRHHFMTYLKIVAALLLMAPLMALVIRVGTMLNPLATLNPVNGNFDPLIGMIMLVGTLWLARRVPTFLRQWATGSSGQTITGKIMGWTGKGAQAIAPAVGVVGTPLAGVAVGAAGGALSGASDIDKRATQQVASLVPNWSRTNGGMNFGVGALGDAGRQVVSGATTARNQTYHQLGAMSEAELVRRQTARDAHKQELADIQDYIASGSAQVSDGYVVLGSDTIDSHMYDRYTRQTESGVADDQYEIQLNDSGQVVYRPREWTPDKVNALHNASTPQPASTAPAQAMDPVDRARAAGIVVPNPGEANAILSGSQKTTAVGVDAVRRPGEAAKKAAAQSAPKTSDAPKSS